MKKIFLVPVLFLAACAQPSANKSGNDGVDANNISCANVKKEVLGLSGRSTQDFALAFSSAIADRSSLCTLEQVTQYLDEVLSIECQQDCLVKEK